MEEITNISCRVNVLQCEFENYSDCPSDFFYLLLSMSSKCQKSFKNTNASQVPVKGLFIIYLI